MLLEFAGSEEDPGDARIIRSHPGMGRIGTAAFLGEAPEVLDNLDLPTMRALTGAAPVSTLTGKKQNRHGPRARPMVQMRRARNHRLANALQHCAATAMFFSERHRLRYTALRQRGHTHARACRQLGDQMLTVMFAMLRNRTLYELPKAP